MHANLPFFAHADAMARHAAQRITHTARNIANADTPGYRAQPDESFAQSQRSFTLTRTRPEHLSAARFSQNMPSAANPSEINPNGNAVSLEDETLKAVDAKRQHDQALALYRHGIGQLRAALGR